MSRQRVIGPWGPWRHQYLRHHGIPTLIGSELVCPCGRRWPVYAPDARGRR